MSFFFQAEDGIRDIGVTGVQTCALPIFSNLLENAHRHGDGAAVRLAVRCRSGWVDLALTQAVVRPERLLGDRKSVGQGKRVDLGGRRIINKKLFYNLISPYVYILHISSS